MPKPRTLRTRTPPDGFEDLEPTLDMFEARMREAEREPHEGKRKCENVWQILRIHHQRNRFIFEKYYRQKEISRELYEWLCENQYADRTLISRWRKQGFERLCCLKCAQTSATNFGTTCICRVPPMDVEPGKTVECITCGCRGCSSGA